MLLPTAYGFQLKRHGLEGNVQRINELCDGIFLTKQGTRPLHEHYSFCEVEVGRTQPLSTLSWGSLNMEASKRGA